ncbi:hypothetical protein QA601_09905 [Chitinispirillales bacterium ANBcel5]|uniref:hypothetical protein n=1 Tax=Cellulosispirillum alkaliphilum TaxID=3039283 RepID=UPI002A577508|nr:hypothetical protein [Chitinispirillales bacterium ANBcel5]
MAGDIMNRSVDSVLWQDYRASDTGMIVFYSSDPVSELPIREVPEQYPSDIIPEPNYETGTYGFYGCSKSKVRTNFIKSKYRYLLFMTKYVGADTEYKDRFFITGYYRVAQTADVKKQHIRYCSDYSCLDEDGCYALRADEKAFVSIEDSFEVTKEVLGEWDFKSRLTRQTRITLNEEQTLRVVNHLQSKQDITSEYIQETQRLQPHGDEDEDVLK